MKIIENKTMIYNQNKNNTGTFTCGAELLPPFIFTPGKIMSCKDACMTQGLMRNITSYSV